MGSFICRFVMTGRLKRRHRSDRATGASSQIRPGDWSVVTDHAQLVKLFLVNFDGRSLCSSHPPLAVVGGVTVRPLTVTWGVDIQAPITQ